MKFQGVVPVLFCHHIQQTLAFYQQGFRYVIINQRQGEHGLDWAHLKSDNSYLMLQRACDENHDQVKADDKILLYYYTDDVEDQYRFMKAKGVDPHAMTTTDYGMKEFCLTDPEGNRLCIGQKADI